MSTNVVIREVTKNVWTFSRPFARFGVFPIGGRSIAVKLETQDGVWVLASTPLTPETKTTIDTLGPVKFIVGANAVHHLFLGEFQNAYPQAKLVAPEAATIRADKSLRFDGVWGRDPVDTKYGFEDEVKWCYFSGFRNKDVAFFHASSKTLIQADLLFSLPANEQYAKAKTSSVLPFLPTLDPNSSMHTLFVKMLGSDKNVMRKDVQTVSDWDFKRVIPCHGDVIENDGKKAWEKVYKAYL